MKTSSVPTLPHVALSQADQAETRLIQDAIQEMGYTLSLTRRPETIVPHLLRTKADIVILNCPFGEMDKHAMARAIHQYPRLSRVHIFVLVPETEATDADIFKAWRDGVHML